MDFDNKDNLIIDDSVDSLDERAAKVATAEKGTSDTSAEKVANSATETEKVDSTIDNENSVADENTSTAENGMAATHDERADDLAKSPTNGDTENGSTESGDTASIPSIDAEKAPFVATEAARSRKSRIFSNLFFVVVIVLSLYFMYELSRRFSGDNDLSFAEMLSGASLKYVALLLGVVVLMIVLDSLKYFIIMRSSCKSKAKYHDALTVSLVGKYYDNITPFSSGGQPFQIVYLNNKGYRGGQSSGVIFIKFAFNMTMWLAICCCLMAFNKDALVKYVGDSSQLNWFLVAGWIGFAINCMLPLFILAFAIFPKMTETITRWMLNIGFKLKIVKDKEHLIDRAKRVAEDFKKGFVKIIHKPVHFTLLALTCLVEPFLNLALPYFAVLAIGGSTVTPGWELMFAIMTLNVYTQMSVMFVPTPGNSLAMESLFMSPLKNIVTDGVLFWTVLGWRFFSYYLFIIIGLMITIIQLVRGNKRKKGLQL